MKERPFVGLALWIAFKNILLFLAWSDKISFIINTLPAVKQFFHRTSYADHIFSPLGNKKDPNRSE